MHYFHVVMILLSTGLYKSAFSACSFCQSKFSSFFVLSVYVFISLDVIFVLCFEFNAISKGLMTFFDFVLALFKRSVEI